MSVFAEKLDELERTAELVLSSDLSDLTAALGRGAGRPAIAIGSGGSAVIAEFLAHCRRSFQRAPTLVQTPLTFVLGNEDVSGSQVWIFSGRGENPDVLATLTSALDRGASEIIIVTSNPLSRLATDATKVAQVKVIVAQAAAIKDGFLATHSLLAAAVALLMASARYVGEDLKLEADALVEQVRCGLERSQRQGLVKRFQGLKANDVILLLTDPRLGALATLIETSIWEIALCAVQRTDFRNFAHGRHVLLAHRPEDAFFLTMTSVETREIWHDIKKHLPDAVRVAEFDYGNCGRFDVFVGLLEGLGIIEAMGIAREIDPAKPRPGLFARDIYEAPSLEKLSRQLTPAVRHKLLAASRYDAVSSRNVDFLVASDSFTARLIEAEFAGIVLDYDGTIVSNENRLDPPGKDILDELERLLDEGIAVALATGRGGSAGKMLRERIKPAHHEHFLVGYYNGAYIKPLSEDVSVNRPPLAPEIAEVLKWLRESSPLLSEEARHEIEDSRVQVSLKFEQLTDPNAFSTQFLQRFGIGSGLKIVRSGHSFDISLVHTCKTDVLKAVCRLIGDPGAAILSIGDRGEPGGNDHVLLGEDYGISVQHVCHRPNVCWTLFGDRHIGPEALLRILRSLVPNKGKVKLVLGEDRLP